MYTNPDSPVQAKIVQTTLLAFVRTMIGQGGVLDDDEHPLPPGPWDPVVRAAVESMEHFSHRARQPRAALRSFGPHPEPWNVVVAGLLDPHLENEGGDGVSGFDDKVALYPQPLPPRYAFFVAVAQTLVGRAELLQELADATTSKGEQQGIIIVSGYVNRFTDDFCGNDFRLRWPYPGRRPHWFADSLSAIDLVIMATQFEDAARQTHSPPLRRSLEGAGSRFAETGLSKGPSSPPSASSALAGQTRTR